MALFNMGSTPDVPFSMYEVPGKIYIFGQAHDATTLTPIFGDFLRNKPGVMGSSSATFHGAKDMSSIRGLHHLENSPFPEMGRYRPTNLGQAYSVPTASSISLDAGQYLTVNSGVINSGGTTLITKYAADGTVISSSTVTCTNALIIHEDELNIYCIGKPNNGAPQPSTGTISYTSTILFSVNKNSLAVAVIESATHHARLGAVYSEAVPLHKSDDGLLVLTYSVKNNSLLADTSGAHTPLTNASIIRITKGGVIERSTTPFNLARVAPMGGLVASEYRLVRETATEIVFMTVAPGSIADSIVENSLQLLYLTINKDSLAVTQEIVPVIIDSAVDFVSYRNFTSTHSLSTFNIQEVTSQEPGVKYFLLTHINGTHYKTVAQSNTFTLKIDTHDSANSRVTQVFKHRANVFATSFTRLSDYNDQFFICYGDQGGDFLQINAPTKSLVKKESVEFPVGSYMVDQVGRFWVQDDSNSSLHMFSQTTTATLKVGFADKNIRFNGTTINSSILVSAYNHLGARVTNNVILSLEGTSCTFADGTKTTTIPTHSDGDAVVAIKIVGNGYIRVAANLAV